ncbi:lipase family protein [Nocardia sp. NPDC050713]|uniref:lipase family protein n=1 Tax=Nocardia sp. NPDC050713 TaxID=3154511 RepID=UPI0034090332
MKRIGRRSRPSLARRLAMVTSAVALGASSVAGVGAVNAEGPPVGSAPGDLISVQPYAFRVLGGLPTPTKAWKIHYRSTDALGNPNVVSGTVIVPEDGATGIRPLVTYAVGTVGMGDHCAPSATLAQSANLQTPSVAMLLGRGWAVAITDYPGLGTPGDHTYLVGRSEGTAVLDAARAAQRLPEAPRLGISTDSPVGITGYSQGGQASAWAAELSSEYAPELRVKAATSGGVPADMLKDALDKRGGGGNPAAALMPAIGHDAAYPELKLDSYLTEAGRELVRKLRGGCVLDNLAAGAGKSLDDMLVSDPLETPEWRQRLGEDKLGTRAPGYPVYLFHGISDEIVSYSLGERLRSDWCASGNTVEWRSYPLTDHVSTALVGGGPALDWLGQRLAGVPTQGNCGA